MYHFFVAEENIDKDAHKVFIEGGDYNHIRNVLRMHPGEEISVGTGLSDDEYRCEIEGYEDGRVICKLMFIKKADVESPVKIILFQGLPKADKMELIIQKCVELGVSEIVPVSCKRCIVKLDDKKAANKIARWQQIAEAAAKQSKRAIIPKVADVMDMKNAIRYAEEMDIKMIPYELAEGTKETKAIFTELKKLTETGNTNGPVPRVAVFIGPEGGFEEEEVKQATETGILPISLGNRILRTETAGMVVLAWINYCLEIE